MSLENVVKQMNDQRIMSNKEIDKLPKKDKEAQIDREKYSREVQDRIKSGYRTLYDTNNNPERAVMDLAYAMMVEQDAHYNQEDLSQQDNRNPLARYQRDQKIIEAAVRKAAEMEAAEAA